MKLEDSLEMKVINIMRRNLHSFVQNSNKKIAASLYEILPSSRVSFHFSVIIEMYTCSVFQPENFT